MDNILKRRFRYGFRMLRGVVARLWDGVDIFKEFGASMFLVIRRESVTYRNKDNPHEEMTIEFIVLCTE